MPLPKKLPAPSSGHLQTKPASSPLSRDAARKDGGRILANRYQLCDKLGSGAFGCAYLVSDHRAAQERKVLKQILVADLQPDETVDAVREARLLAKLDHPSIVKFHDSFMDKDFFCIITEYCEGGDLDMKIVKWRQTERLFEESLILDWFIQLTTALRYIHERRILHRDLKTRNIFLKNNLIKLGDFGISRILMGTSDLATTFTGTPYYMSPEVLKHDGYNAKSDIWSLGVVLYELCTLQHAFQGQNLMAVMYKIVEGDQPQLPDHFNPLLQTLFIKMLDKEPCVRPTAVEILQEPFIQKRMENLRGRMTLKKQSSSVVAEEAEAIARALSPVKKKNLVQEDRSMTPRQRMALRKKQTADKEAEARRKLARKNFSEGQHRFNVHKKKQARVIPPWVEEHPDVFNDPNFSITQLDSSTSGGLELTSSLMTPTGGLDSMTPTRGQNEDTIGSDMDTSLLRTFDPPPLVELADGEKSVAMEMSIGGVVAPNHETPPTLCEDVIPEDPLLAETHYSQFDDFEVDDSESEDEYDAFLDCLDDALDLPNQQPVPAASVPESTHDDLSPFTPLAREKRINILREQCQQIYGREGFRRVYEYLKSARSASGIVDEGVVMAGLRGLVANVRDCFLVDQLVFLEKQAENSSF